MGKGNKAARAAAIAAKQGNVTAANVPATAQQPASLAPLANGQPVFASGLTGLPTTKVVATLVGNAASPVSKGNLQAFLNAHGGPANVYVVPLQNCNFAGNGANPVPFGYNGQPNGVRKTIQTWLLFGVQGVRTYAAIMGAAKPLGHSSVKPVCLFAMLNGGYSPSSPTWGTPYCALVAYAAAQQPAAQQPAQTGAAA